MEFLDRFKGRTCLLTKEGILSSLAPSSNPINKTEAWKFKSPSFDDCIN